MKTLLLVLSMLLAPGSPLTAQTVLFGKSAAFRGLPQLAAIQLDIDASRDTTTPGNTPTSIPDWSGNSRTMTVNGTPTVQTVSSRNYYRFNGTTDYFSLAAQNVASTWGITSAFTVIAVIKNDLGAGNNRPLYWWTSSAEANEFTAWYQFSDNNAYLDCGNTAAGGRISGAVAANTALKLVSLRRNGSSGKMREDGVDKVTSNSFSDSLDSGSATFYFGNIGGSLFDGDLGRLVIWNVALTDDELTYAESQLRSYWGTP